MTHSRGGSTPPPSSPPQSPTTMVDTNDSSPKGKAERPIDPDASAENPEDQVASSPIDRDEGDFPLTVVERQPTFTAPVRSRAFSRSSAAGQRVNQVLKHATMSREYDPNLVTWDGPHDPHNPLNWPDRYKWMLTTICGVLTINVTFGSSAPSTTVLDMPQQFGISSAAANLTTAIFLAGYVPGPLFWGPSSELVGRRPLFFLSVGIYSLFNIGSALAQNFGTLLVTRFLGGVFAAAPLTNCGGVIADIWDPVNRGLAMSIFSSCVFIGPVMGPIVGGFVSQSYLGWRWIYWLQLIYGGACFVLCFFMPETYAPVLLTRKAKKLRKADPGGNKKRYAAHEHADWSFKGIMQRTLLRPFYMLIVEPILALITVYLAYIYGLLYGTFGVFPIIWEMNHGFNRGQSGLIFVSVGIGTTFGAIVNAIVQRHYRELVPAWKGSPPPEERLHGAKIAAPLLAIGLFWLCWTGAYPAVPWYVPALAGVPLGMSFSMLFISFLSYIVDTYLMFAASALTANTFVRAAVGAAFPMFVQQMFNNLGIQWAGTLLGCLALLALPSPFLFFKYGANIRERSSFAPALDIKLKAKWDEEKKQRENNPDGNAV